MNLSQIRDMLSSQGLRPLKQFGQNFLHDQNICRWLAAEATRDLSAGDQVLEIGPGLGALTEPLLEAGFFVLAIEKDIGMTKALRSRFPAGSELGNRLELIIGDALEIVPTSRWQSAIRVVGNWPYNISSPLLATFLLHEHPPEQLVIMLQDEIVDRLAAKPGTKDYGALSVLVQIDYDCQRLKRIPPTAFYPQPEINSAVLRLTRRSKSPLPNAAARQNFYDWVRRGFSQRRKTLANTLEIAGEIGRLRPEALTPLQWVELFLKL